VTLDLEVVFAAEGELRVMAGSDCRFGDAPCSTPAQLRPHCATRDGFKFFLYDNETESAELRGAARALGKVAGPDPWTVAPGWDGRRASLPLALVEAGAIQGQEGASALLAARAITDELYAPHMHPFEDLGGASRDWVHRSRARWASRLRAQRQDMHSVLAKANASFATHELRADLDQEGSSGAQMSVGLGE